ncbi:hypothetical protein AMTR_s00071p00098340 [Amborella trichopoda]|uniref:Pathogen-related protein n=1 Tax=Amborella trichopoda TaxID=13333 RepID=U5DHH1_AMBTC|nr:hypothetical protein AMTR_s00071p00098340 [Amborella trichopoda]
MREKNTVWRHGALPNYDIVNKLFEEERQTVWPEGSLEEKVQNLVKTWEMEIFHKARLEDFKTLDPNKFTFSLNGRKELSLPEVAKMGGYNPLLQTSLPEEFQCYNPKTLSGDASHEAFLRTFPRGFALEIVRVYLGPPTIVFKFRHWGYNEGPFLGHASTGERVELFGIGIFQIKIENIELFYDRGELLGGLMKGSPQERDGNKAIPSSCPALLNM